LITLATIALAGLLGWAMWRVYMDTPWTRDATVRAYVVTMAPEVSGRTGRVGSIVFRPFDIALHVARRHQAHGVTELGDFTRPMMSGSAGFHADQASRNLAKEVDDLLAPQLAGDDDLARTIQHLLLH